MEKTKRILSFFIALLMILTIIPMNAIVLALEAGDNAETQTQDSSEKVPVKPAASDIDTEAELERALQEGGKVVLGASLELTKELVVPAGVTVTLDLNGYNLTAAYQTGSTSKHNYVLRNKGVLTIEDTVDTGAITGRGIYNGVDGADNSAVKLTVNGAKIVSVDTNGGSSIWSYGGEVYLNDATLIGYTGCVSAKGYLEINGGTYDCYSGILDNGDQATNPTYNIRAYNGLKITDGKFTSRHGVISVGGGECVIEKGSYTIDFTAKTTSNVVYVYGDADLTINGGSFLSDNSKDIADSGAAVVVSGSDAKVTINKGTFQGMNGAVSGNANTVIYGGSFDIVWDYDGWDNLKNYIHVGSMVVIEGTGYIKNADGTCSEVAAPSAEISNLTETVWSVTDSADREAFNVQLKKIIAYSSLKIEVYSGDILLTTTTAKDKLLPYIDNGTAAEGFNRLTVNIVLSGKASSSWDTVVETASLTEQNIPNYIKVYCDDVLVAEGERTFNAEWIAAYKGLDSTKKPALPNALVTVPDRVVIHDYRKYNGSSIVEVTGAPIDPQVLLNFKALDSADQAANGGYGDYYTDFFITLSGLESSNTDGCYLVGNYGTWGWVAIPLAGMELKDVTYSVMSNIIPLKYKEICKDVKDFTCGIYFTPEFLNANPDFEITLDLGLFENLDNVKNGNFANIEMVTGEKEFSYTAEVIAEATRSTELPNAEVNDITGNVVDIKEFRVFLNGKLSEGTGTLNPQIVLEFLAKDTEKEAAESYYADFTTDFFITLKGVVNSNTDGCYLIGNYGEFGWIAVPLDGMELKDDTYSVITSVGFDFTYEDICTVVKDFKCGIYFTPEFLANNPDFEITLDLGLCKDKETAQAADLNNVTLVTTKDQFSYTVEEIKTNRENNSAVAQIGNNKYATLEEAFKAATEGCTIEILADVVIDYKWDCRDYATGGSHSQFNESVTINGNGHTIKFTGTVNDNNWNTIFRFEENATVNNITIDISEATGAQRVITAKKSLTVNGLTIVGAAKYGIIFGEGASAADLAAAEIVIKNSNLNGTRRAISDNEGGKDVKSVTITDNTLNANTYVSASESVTFTGNTVTNGYVDIRSYTANNTLDVTATGNTLKANTETAYNEINAGGTVNAQEGFVLPKVYLAQIGNEKFETVAAAVEYAKAQGIKDLTITLIGDTTAESALALEDSFYLVYDTAFENVTIKQADPSKPYYIDTLYTGDRTAADGKFVFDGVNLVIVSQIWFECDVVLKNNSVVTRTNDVKNFIYYGSITIEEGSHFVSQIDHIYAGAVTVDGGKLTSIFFTVDAGHTLVIKNGAEVIFNSVNEIGSLELYGTTEITGSTLSVLDTIVIGANGCLKLDVNSTVSAGKITGNGKIVIDVTGFDGIAKKIINANMSGFTGAIEIVGGKAAYEITDSGLVVKEAPVAQVGDTYYATLEEAFANANGGTVVLLADIALDTTAVVKGDVTLDLNGKTISGTCDANQQALIRVENGAKLAVKDTAEGGKITFAQGTSNVGWTIDVKGEFVLESGTIELTGSWSIGYAVEVRPNSWGTEYQTGSVFTMNGGNIVSSDGGVRVASSSAAAHKNVSASFVMNGGKIDAAWDGVFIQQSDAIYDDLSFTMNGGTIESDLNPIRVYGPAATGYVNDQNCMSIVLAGGTMTYTGTEEQTWVIDGILRVGGGSSVETILENGTLTVTEAIAQTTAPDGYKWVANDKGYTLAECNYVAQVGDNKYESFAEALAALANGGTLTLLADVTTSTTVVIKANTVIDGNGHTLTYTGSDRAIDIPANADAKVNVTISNLTVDCTASYCQRGINYNDDGALTLNNVTVKGTNVTYALNLPGSSDNCVVTINDSNITGRIALNIWGANSKITATNTVFTSVDNITAEDYVAISLNNDGAGNAATGSVVTINGGKIIARDDKGEPSTAVRVETIATVNVSAETEVVGKTVRDVVIVVYEGYSEFYSFDDLQEAIDKAIESNGKVVLLDNITISKMITVNGEVEIDLNGKKVTSTAQKAFEIYANATIKNGTIEAAQRCVDTRKAVEITLDGVTLIADKYTSHGNPQPLTIGGSEDGTKVTLTNVNISSAAGYGIITFVKTNLTATNCTIGGYNALYVKPGSEESVFNFASCVLTGSTASNDVEGNSFSTIAVRADDVTVNVDANSTITASGNYCWAISLDSKFTGESGITGANITVAGTINGQVVTSVDASSNTVTLKADYADEVTASGFAYITNNDGTITLAKAEEKLEIWGTSLVLDGEIKMNFFFSEKNVYIGTDYYAVITIPGSNREEIVPMSEWGYNEVTKRYFVTVGMPAKCMTENIFVEIVKDDTVLTEEFYNSIEYYAYSVIYGNYAEDLKALMVNMLVYGAEAQKHFKYNTDFLATHYIEDAIIEKYATKMATPADPGYFSVIEPDGKYYFYDNTLELEAYIGFNFYYEFTKADASSLKVTTSYVDFYGNAHTNVISGEDLVFNTAMGREMLKVSVTGLKSTDIFQAVTVVIEYNGEVISTATESVAGYCHYRMDADDVLDGVCLALLKYGAAAEKYFG